MDLFRLVWLVKVKCDDATATGPSLAAENSHLRSDRWATVVNLLILPLVEWIQGIHSFVLFILIKLSDKKVNRWLQGVTLLFRCFVSFSLLHLFVPSLARSFVRSLLCLRCCFFAFCIRIPIAGLFLNCLLFFVSILPLSNAEETRRTWMSIISILSAWRISIERRNSLQPVSSYVFSPVTHSRNKVRRYGTKQTKLPTADSVRIGGYGLLTLSLVAGSDAG